jgi:hypothetical protein
MSKITRYCIDELKKSMEEKFPETVFAIQVTGIKHGVVTLKLGISNTEEFLLEFETVHLCFGDTVHIEGLKVPLKEWLELKNNA